GWGGAPAARDLVRRMREMGVHLFTNYGLTEGGAVVSATGPDDGIDDLAGTVGRPNDSGDYQIVDDHGRAVGAGQAGEIWLKGPGVFLGYWNNPAATAAAMAPGGWLRTSDVALARPDGAWVLSGRKADMFKSGGFNVYPREIEQALEEHPDVAYAAVISVPDPRYFEVGAAFVAAKPGCSPTPAEIDAFLRERLANYKVPKTIQVRDTLPMLPIGKVDKHALRDDLARADVSGA
ncbi:MAG TPA: AMP-binding protein, partial [Caulobacteraceae bacterium]|nr:AMP-binding protein [Caulobacteraceae bacterium]